MLRLEMVPDRQELTLLVNNLLTVPSFLSNLQSAFFPLSSSSDEVGGRAQVKRKEEMELIINNHSIALARVLNCLSRNDLKIKMFHPFVSKSGKQSTESDLSHSYPNTLRVPGL